MPPCAAWPVDHGAAFLATLSGALTLFTAGYFAAGLLTDDRSWTWAKSARSIVAASCFLVGLGFYSFAALGDFRAAWGLCSLECREPRDSLAPQPCHTPGTARV
jgi:hypothetical protein